MRTSKRPYLLYCHASIAIAVVMGVSVYYLSPPSSEVWLGVLVFTILAAVSHLKPVSIQPNMFETAITVPITWAAIVLFGPFWAMVVASAAVIAANTVGWISAHSIVSWQMARTNQWVHRILQVLAGPWQDRSDYPFRWTMQQIFANASFDAIAVGAAAATYRAVGGMIATYESLTYVSSWGMLVHYVLPFLAAAFTYSVVSEIEFATTGILGENRPEDTRDWYSFILKWRLLLIESLPMNAGQYILLPPVTLLMLYLYVHVGMISCLVVLGPFLALRSAVQKSVERQQIYRDTIATLGTYMQHYHPYTRGHLKRVAELSEQLARELRLPLETIKLMPYAGLLHDIGKVGVSEDILDKVGKLTDEEWATIKEHPVKGAEIVEHLDFLNRTVDWIRYHHKWANGSGYPDDGVKNGGVPIEAAIIAVADAFDAMTDDRERSLEWVCDACGFNPENDERPVNCPQCGAAKRRTYREPLSFEQAIDELRRGAGSQFSPKVVKAFLQMMDREGIGVAGGS